MKISVVVPVFNEEKYIGQCLQSLKKQIEAPDEIIVVDNASTDRTAEVINQFPVKTLTESLKGIIPARNAGFDAAKYDIIARCDADAIVPPDWIKKIKADFEKSKIDGLSGPIVFYDLPLKTTLWVRLFFTFMRFIQKGSETIVGPNMAITKKIWQKIRNSVCLDDRMVHEDVDIGMHVLQAGGAIKMDTSLVVQISGRRIIHDPFSFFIEYPIRLAKSIKSHPL
jgi:glycosyltransferase involved in cell wall biosynthesis